MRYLYVGAAIALVGAGAWWYWPRPTTAPIPQELTFTIWHTESDVSARRELQRIAEQFQNEVLKQSQAQELSTLKKINVSVEFVPWDQLPLKLSTVLGKPAQPDLTHLEPYMTAALWRQQQLLPLDEVLLEMDRANRPVLPSVRDLQKFGNRHYGLAYAVGTTFTAYRRDWAKEAGLDYTASPPRTWSDLIRDLPRFSEAARKNGARGLIILPGGAPFFMDQYFGELLAARGGALFEQDATGTFKPQFESEAVFDTLKFLSNLRPFLIPNWGSTTYLDQFTLLANGQGGFAPVTYGRATLVLQKEAGSRGTDKVFGVMRQLGPTPDTGKATIDCEDWSVLTRQEPPAVTSIRRRLAVEFLLRYYEPRNYVTFAASVPVHLTPIFTDISSRPTGEYWQQPNVADWLQRWSSWAEMSGQMLQGRDSSGRALVNPILMSRAEDNANPYIFEAQKGRVITDMVNVALDPASNDAGLKQAQQRAQQTAMSIIQRYEQSLSH